jgi:CubicO group peptidase (beta-lactamase class C family)
MPHRGTPLFSGRGFMSRWSTLSDRCERGFVPVAAAIAAGRIPGAVLGVTDRSGRSAVRHAGRAQITPAPEPMRAETVFDLASLTKPLFTTAALLRLVEAGRITLDDTLGALIPDLRQYHVDTAPERRLRLLDVLAHHTHLPAVEPLYTLGLDPATLRAFILQRVWAMGPPVYSDINFLLAGIVLERVTGVALADQKLPDGFSFRPDPEACAATEFCTWRGRVMRGAVHDENAAAFGGAAGHAGLFGSAQAVLETAARLLRDTAADAPIRTRIHADRTVGWQAPSPGWSGSERCSPATIGHTGFTGTGLWLDFDRGLAWTLLTNRVHPTRHADSGIAALRRAVAEAVLGE